MTNKKIRYYAYARTSGGELAQLLVTRIGGKQVNQIWTGKTYRSQADANRDMIRLNCE